MRFAILSCLISIVAGCAAEAVPENDVPTDTSPHRPSPPQPVSYEAQAPDDGSIQPHIFGPLTGAALRFDGWPNLNGEVSFGFNWGAIHAGSHVFISTSEVDNTGARFMGAANYTVQNVVVKEGRVEFRVFIDWPSPIRVSTDIFTLDP